MAGIRIRHHTRRSQVLPVPLLFQPWPDNRNECGTCHTIHPCKVVHLNLDDTGTVIITESLREKLWRVPQHAGFRVVGHVAKPPAQNVAPETIKVKLRGIDIGGGLEQAEPNRRYATTPGPQPEKKTVDLDEYVDIANRHGIETSVALNVLLAHILGFVKEPA